jgi:hypothetical protein
MMPTLSPHTNSFLPPPLNSWTTILNTFEFIGESLGSRVLRSTGKEHTKILFKKPMNERFKH